MAAFSEERLEGPVRFGTVQDLADVVLPSALAAFAKQYPAVTLHVEVADSAVLVEQAHSGTLDFCVCFRSRHAPRTIRREPMVWLGSRSVATMDPVRLAVLDPPCGFRDAAIAALKRLERPHRIVLRTPSLAGLRAALEAGLGIGCRTSLLHSPGIEILGEAEGLPPPTSVYRTTSSPRSARSCRVPRRPRIASPAPTGSIRSSSSRFGSRTASRRPPTGRLRYRMGWGRSRAL